MEIEVERPIITLTNGPDLEFLSEQARLLEAGAVILELGSFLMGSALIMALANPNTTVYAVDTGHLDWLVPTHETAKYLTEQFGVQIDAESAVKIREEQLARAPNIIWHQTFSRAFYPPIAPSFCFIDADHSRHAVLADFWHCWEIAKPGAIIAGHDHILESVQKAVKDIELTLEVKPTMANEQIWYWKKA